MKTIKVKVERVMYYANGRGIFACEPLTEYLDMITLNNYGNIAIKGSTFELVKGNEYTIDIEDDIEKSPKGDSYNIIKVHLPKELNASSQYNFLKTLVTELQFNKIVDAFPPSEDFKIIDEIKKGTVDLTTLKGFTERNLTALKKKIESKEELMHVYNRLIPVGLTETAITNVVKHFVTPARVLEKVNESMYNLCEVKGLGFTTVDEYALADGEDINGEKRIVACINYVIHDQAQLGHSWISRGDLVTKTNELLQLKEIQIEEVIDKIEDGGIKGLLVVDEIKVTNSMNYNIENSLLKHLNRLNNSYESIFTTEELKSAIETAESKLGITYTEEQSSVVEGVMSEGVTILNGKAGTGKSTIMKGITELCSQKELMYRAVALSGRAAQLLTLKGINASTIHRLLGVGNDGEFAHNEYTPLPHDVILLEEASMANAYLILSIAKAMKDGSKLIIVGDSGQLSAIGNGDVLRDLLSTTKFKSFELLQIHRQAKDSGIIDVASKIRDGVNITGYNYQLSNQYGVNKDLGIFTYNNKELLYQNAKKVIENKMKKVDTESIMDFQILVSNKTKGQFSTVQINNYCQAIYNGVVGKGIKVGNYEYRVNDKVIMNGNNYGAYLFDSVSDFEDNKEFFLVDESSFVVNQTELFNGTIGIIKYVDTTKGNEHILVDFEGHDGVIYMDKKLIGSLDLAYAITVAKSQGMSIHTTLFLLDFGAYLLLNKQQVYTGITRASNKCMVIAENNALQKAINVDNSGSRRTFLRDLINKETE